MSSLELMERGRGLGKSGKSGWLVGIRVESERGKKERRETGCWALEVGVFLELNRTSRIATMDRDL